MLRCVACNAQLSQGSRDDLCPKCNGWKQSLLIDGNGPAWSVDTTKQIDDEKETHRLLYGEPEEEQEEDAA